MKGPVEKFTVGEKWTPKSWSDLKLLWPSFSDEELKSMWKTWGKNISNYVVTSIDHKKRIITLKNTIFPSSINKTHRHKYNYLPPEKRRPK